MCCLRSTMAAACAPSTLCHSCDPGCNVPMQAAEGTPLALKLTALKMHRLLIPRICCAMQAAKGILFTSSLVQHHSCLTHHMTRQLQHGPTARDIPSP